MLQDSTHAHVQEVLAGNAGPAQSGVSEWVSKRGRAWKAREEEKKHGKCAQGILSEKGTVGVSKFSTAVWNARAQHSQAEPSLQMTFTAVVALGG